MNKKDDYQINLLLLFEEKNPQDAYLDKMYFIMCCIMWNNYRLI